MKRYHYSTWNGYRVHQDGCLYPSVAYERFTGSTIVSGVPLVFLTTNPEWEPSVQTRSAQLHWEKCGSCPKVYTELGIPCWRFEVEPDLGKPAVGYFDTPDWNWMLSDAIVLGSEPDQWYVCNHFVNILRSWQWRNGRWSERLSHSLSGSG